jgi:2-polyprenyl-6-methoxyphenol hydroxylase-like FAD-dependent oxidoreductase
VNIVVVGGGIAGLIVAKGLIAAGHVVTVLERAPEIPEIRAVGAGFGLWPTAMSCLRRLGLDAAVEGSVWVRGFEFRNAAGGCLARADTLAASFRMPGAF